MSLPFLKQYLNVVNHWIPSASQGSSIGIDIGVNECRFIEIIKLNQSFEVLGWACESMAEEDIGSVFKKILAKAKYPSKSPYVAVYGKGTLIRYISLPRMSLFDLKKSFIIEAERYFPFPSDQIYTDCFILDPKEKTKQMLALVAAAKKDLIEERIKLLSGLGLQPFFVGINPIALANAFHVLGESQEENKDSSVALLDIGETVTSLIIFKNRLPWFTRDIFLGQQDILKKISHEQKISLPEAERLATSAEKTENWLALCETEIMQIVQEVRLSFDYFTTEKNQEINRLLLTGVAAKIRGLSELLEKNLEIKVSLWDPLIQLKKTSESLASLTEKDSLKMGVALGLALYQYD